MTDPHPPKTPPDLHTGYAARTDKVGDVVVGTIVKITGSVAFVDFGGRSQGYIQLSDLRGPDGELDAKDGDRVEAEIINTRGAIQLSTRNLDAARRLSEVEAAWKEERTVTGKVVAANKGGWEVRINGARAFCPTSQTATPIKSDLRASIGESFTFRITEFTDNGRNLVVSRRAALDEAREQRQAAITGELREGDVRQGKVTKLTEFGAFVDLGDGLEGLIHVSEISREHIRTPEERLSVGDAIEVKIIGLDSERGRIRLSIKALEADPWDDFVRTLSVGQSLTGRITRVQPFGAFVELAPQVEGLLHVSAIRVERVEDATTELTPDTEIEVIIEAIDPSARRIKLMTPAAAEKRRPAEITVKVGDIVTGPVVRAEKYGVFIEIAPRLSGLIPGSEMDTDREVDLVRAFPVGTSIEAKVIEVDKSRGRVRLSRKAAKHHEEDMAIQQYREQQKAAGSGLGTFGELFGSLLTKKP